MADKTKTKKKDDVADDLVMYTGIVRLYRGDPRKNEAIEDMMVERFPATSPANAQQCLMNFAHNWFNENGIEEGGCQILLCHPDDDLPATGKAAQPTTVANIVDRGEQNPVRAARKEKNPPAFVAFSCPVVGLCSTRYSGEYDTGSGSIYVKKEVVKP